MSRDTLTHFEDPSLLEQGVDVPRIVEPESISPDIEPDVEGDYDDETDLDTGVGGTEPGAVLHGSELGGLDRIINHFGGKLEKFKIMYESPEVAERLRADGVIVDADGRPTGESIREKSDSPTDADKVQYELGQYLLNNPEGKFFGEVEESEKGTLYKATIIYADAEGGIHHMATEYFVAAKKEKEDGYDEELLIENQVEAPDDKVENTHEVPDEIPFDLENPQIDEPEVGEQITVYDLTKFFQRNEQPNVVQEVSSNVNEIVTVVTAGVVTRTEKKEMVGTTAPVLQELQMQVPIDAGVTVKEIAVLEPATSVVSLESLEVTGVEDVIIVAQEITTTLQPDQVIAAKQEKPSEIITMTAGETGEVQSVVEELMEVVSVEEIATPPTPAFESDTKAITSMESDEASILVENIAPLVTDAIAERPAGETNIVTPEGAVEEAARNEVLVPEHVAEEVGVGQDTVVVVEQSAAEAKDGAELVSEVVNTVEPHVVEVHAAQEVESQVARNEIAPERVAILESEFTQQAEARTEMSRAEAEYRKEHEFFYRTLETAIRSQSLRQEIPGIRSTGRAVTSLFDDQQAANDNRRVVSRNGVSMIIVA